MPPKRSYKNTGPQRRKNAAKLPRPAPEARSPEAGGTADGKEQGIQVEGVVVENLPNATFKVKVEAGGQEHEVLAHVSGKIRMNFIRILPGDRVLVELSPYDLKRGRILYRYKGPNPEAPGR